MKLSLWMLPDMVYGHEGENPKKILIDDNDVFHWVFSGELFRNKDDIPELPWKTYEEYDVISKKMEKRYPVRWVVIAYLKNDRSKDGAFPERNFNHSFFYCYMEQLPEDLQHKLFDELRESKIKYGDPLKGSCS